MKAGSRIRWPGCAATQAVIGWRMPAPTSSARSTKVSMPSAPRSRAACSRVRDRCRSYADPSLTPIRTPSASTSADVRERRVDRDDVHALDQHVGRGELQRASRVDGEEADVGASLGHRGHRVPGGAVALEVDVDAEPGRDLAGQGDGDPDGASGVPEASTGLPRLMDARSAPVGARSVRMADRGRPCPGA